MTIPCFGSILKLVGISLGVVQYLNSPFPILYSGWIQAGEEGAQDSLYAHVQNATIYPSLGNEGKKHKIVELSKARA